MTPELLSELKTKVSAGLLAFETALDTLYQSAHDFVANATAGTTPSDPAPVTTDPAAAVTTDPTTAVTGDPSPVVTTDPAAAVTTDPAPAVTGDPSPVVTTDPAANAGTVETITASDVGNVADVLGTAAAPTPLEVATAALDAAKLHQSGDIATDEAAVAAAQAAVDALSIPAATA